MSLGLIPFALEPLGTSPADSLPAINGDLSQTLGAVNFTAFGVASIVGTASNTLGNIQNTATAIAIASGSLSISLNPIAFSASGVAGVIGSSTQNLGFTTLVADGSTVSGAAHGISNQQLASIFAEQTGVTFVSAISLQALDAVSFNANGDVLDVINGQSNIQLDAIYFSADGSVGSGYTISIDRTWVVPFRNRKYLIPPSNRIYKVKK